MMAIFDSNLLLGYEIKLEDLGGSLAQATIDLENVSIDLFESYVEEIESGEREGDIDIAILGKTINEYLDRIPYKDEIEEEDFPIMVNALHEFSQQLSLFGMNLIAKAKDNEISDIEVSFVNTLLYTINVFNNLERYEKQFSKD